MSSDRGRGWGIGQNLPGDLAWRYLVVDKIDRFESIYSVLGRFALINSLSGQAVLTLLKSKSRTLKGAFVVGLENLSSVNTIELERCVGASQAQVFEMFLVPSYSLNALICPYFRFCPVCISARKHYAIFQWERLATCPFHSVRLRSACLNCGSSIVYEWAIELFDSPFCCPRCQASLSAQQNHVGYFDVHNRAWFHALNSTYTKLRGAASYRLSKADNCNDESLMGFLVFSSAKHIVEGWYHLEKLPLQGLTLDEINWQHHSGYIQIRGFSPKTKKQTVTERAFDRSGLVRDLMPCLKAILRNLRRIRRREQSQSLRSNLYAFDHELLCRREEAYGLLLQCWCGKPQRGRYTSEGMRLTIEGWLNRQVSTSCEPRCFLAVTPWLITHLFCGQVMESIAAVTQVVIGPPELLDNFSMSLSMVRSKPLWYVALMSAFSVVSFRVIHHHQFRSSLWAPCV
jgi:hypothetical protein